MLKHLILHVLCVELLTLRPDLIHCLRQLLNVWLVKRLTRLLLKLNVIWRLLLKLLIELAVKLLLSNVLAGLEWLTAEETVNWRLAVLLTQILLAVLLSDLTNLYNCSVHLTVRNLAHAFKLLLLPLTHDLAYF